jgi:hypothetical protein
MSLTATTLRLRAMALVACAAATASAQADTAPGNGWPLLYVARPFPVRPLACALSPDGRRLATRGPDGRIAYGPVGGPPTWRADCERLPLGDIGIGPDGAVVWVATAGDAGPCIRIFAAVDGRRVADAGHPALGTATRGAATRGFVSPFTATPLGDGRVAFVRGGIFSDVRLRDSGGARPKGAESGESLAVSGNGGHVALRTYGSTPGSAESVALFDVASSRPVAAIPLDGLAARVVHRTAVDVDGRRCAIAEPQGVRVRSFDRPEAAGETFGGPAASIAFGDGAWYVGTADGALETWRDGERVARWTTDVGPFWSFKVRGRTAAVYGSERSAIVLDGIVVGHAHQYAKIQLDGNFAAVQDADDAVRVFPDLHDHGPYRGAFVDRFGKRAGRPSLAAGRLAMPVEDGVAVYDLVDGGAPVFDGSRHGSDAYDATWQGEELLVFGAEVRPAVLDLRGDVVERLPTSPPPRDKVDRAVAFGADGAFAVSVDDSGASVKAPAPDSRTTTYRLPTSGDRPRTSVAAAPRGDAFLVAQFDVDDPRASRREVHRISSFRLTPNVGRIFLGTVRHGVRTDRPFPSVARDREIPMTYVGPDTFAIFDGKDVVVRAVDDLRTLTVLPGPADFLRGSPDGRFLAVVDRGEVRIYRRP